MKLSFHEKAESIVFINFLDKSRLTIRRFQPRHHCAALIHVVLPRRIGAVERGQPLENFCALFRKITRDPKLPLLLVHGRHSKQTEGKVSLQTGVRRIARRQRCANVHRRLKSHQRPDQIALREAYGADFVVAPTQI